MAHDGTFPLLISTRGSHHEHNRLDQLTNVKSSARHEQLDTPGDTGGCTHIGDLQICAHDSTGGSHYMTLHDILYVRDGRCAKLSVQKLWESRVRVDFDDRTRIVLPSGVIFEFDSENGAYTWRVTRLVDSPSRPEPLVSFALATRDTLRPEPLTSLVHAPHDTLYHDQLVSPEHAEHTAPHFSSEYAARAALRRSARSPGRLLRTATDC